MAFGPFLSAMTNEVEFTAFGMRFNGLTNPGWVMFVLWTIMGVVVYMEFQASGDGAVLFPAECDY